ncbi:MAG: biopolymer transporter ExbD [Microcoleus sp. CAN_BIN18]|nr:biopolymer transporter ExbD [Microcoleus sp. CAN_BIN18]
MKIHLDTPAEEARIELVPLIDVIFCILTFFLLASLQLTRQQAINVDLPKAKTGQTQMREMLIVSIDDFGQTYIDQVPVNYQQLDQVLKSFQSQNPAGLTVLYAPQNAKYAKVVEVLDRLRELGGRVSLGTVPASVASPQPNPSLPNSGIPVAPGTGNSGQPQPNPVAPGQQQFNPNQFQSPLPAPGQPTNSGANQGIPPASPAPAAPNFRPGVASPPSQNVVPSN